MVPIFFSKNEKSLLNGNLANLYYFKDRTEIGVVEPNIENLNNSINAMQNTISTYSKKINVLRNNRIEYFDSSMKQNLINIKKILNDEKND